MGNTLSPCTPLEKDEISPCVKTMGESECEVNHVLKIVVKALNEQYRMKWLDVTTYKYRMKDLYCEKHISEFTRFVS